MRAAEHKDGAARAWQHRTLLRKPPEFSIGVDTLT